MELIQLIYVSRPFGFDEAMLNGILVDSRRNNERAGITGSLVCRADIYLQLLEGPRPAVEAAFARIADDDRHIDIVRLSTATADDRLFPDWAMRDDPARSWMWSPTEVAAGAPLNATPGELRAIFERLFDEPV